MQVSISAKVIADSISPTGSRLTTVECSFPRFILSEINTHRAFSRNSASTRAIPTAKLIKQVRENPFIPIEFGRNQPGMQADGPMDESESKAAEIVWLRASREAADQAERLMEMGVHKQIAGRVLEPFMTHRCIITSTEAGWENFFDQRCSALAQPEIEDLAWRIWQARQDSEPVELGFGDWHLPYVTHDDPIHSDGRKISAARCARVSYLTHEGKRDLEKDMELYDKLITADPPHWSPMEHVATPASEGCEAEGNFDGWCQLRHLGIYQ